MICSVCGEEFIYDDIMSSDDPMCDKCAEKEWQQLLIKNNDKLRSKYEPM